MGECFPYGKYSEQTQRTGWIVAKPSPLLHLVPSPREKKPEKKRRSLIRLGVEQGQAYAWSRSRMGGWAIAKSPILGTTITVERLKKRGYVSLLDIYKKISPQLNEPRLKFSSDL